MPVKYELEGGPAANLGAAENYVLSAPMPHYPRATVAYGVHGKGRFQLIIDPKTGLVTDVKILETTHDERLDRAAVKAFRQWRFRPNTIQTLVVPFSFKLGYG